jgi:DNA-binding response OmpR family regulator
MISTLRRKGLMNNQKDVLIVDDDPDIVEVLSMILEDAGFTTRTLNSREMPETLRDDIPGVLLLDVWMSGRDGRDICRYLKSQQLTRDLPIIFISANNNIQQFVIDAGADDYLAKPFNMDEVIAKVGKYLAT